MLKPTVKVQTEAHALVAEFWDCLRLDPAPVKELRSKYEAHLQNGGRPVLVVDLLGVGFAGSAALGLFVTVQKLVRQRGGQIIFCNVDPTITEVFRISKLDSMFLFVSDKPAALARAAELDAAIAAAPGTPPAGGSKTTPADPRTNRDSGNDNLLRKHRRRML